MRIDIVSIFPEFFAHLDVSLLGKAREAGLVTWHTHDLREHAHDRHRTVDDTPYGGGAGMVMQPEPWGEALDGIIADGTGPPTIVVPTPAGTPLTQRLAQELAEQPHLIFACGRYEGIDQRVADHYAGRDDVARVREVSIGDYVLNGGEAAVTVMIEAAVRLIPGFMGNAQSLAEESHGAAGLLEYPVFTKPRTWRGIEVPPALLSGHHAEVDAWRLAAARSRTAQRRPDLLHASHTIGAGTDGVAADVDVRSATAADAPELWVLQRACWAVPAADEASPATEDLDDVRRGLTEWTAWVARSGGRLVASVRARRVDDAWEIARIMVAPDLQGRGLGRWLLAHAEAASPDDALQVRVIAEPASAARRKLVTKAGYRPAGRRSDGAATLDKRR